MSISELESTVDDKALSQALEFFKLPPGVDDNTVKMLILAARRDVIGQVGNLIDDFYDDNPIFQAAVLLDAYTMYNNRDRDSTAMIFEHPIFGKQINALKDDYREMLSDYGPDDDLDDQDNDYYGYDGLLEDEDSYYG